ncbi:MAG TPA: CocE/NonD family hydrolase [Actinomycetota bacterium]|nr:CocE/NonD family hydrolase [Actinomycetota bacterium]
MRRFTSLALALVAGVTMLGSLGVAHADGPSGYDFVTMPDGVKIAISVAVPEACEAAPCPAIFEMSGYDGGGASADDRGTLCGHEFNCGTLEDDSRQLTRHFDDEYPGREYVIVHASVRGSGCSGGEFDLFAWQGALDGKYIIDNWIPKQPWSNGDVGIIGHSYGGLTGTLIAATQPEQLRVISVSGLIDDLYRGIVYPGGVSNYGFPLLWTGGIRTAYDVGGGLMPRLFRPIFDGYEHQAAECGGNVPTKSRSVINDAIVQGASDTDTDWFRARSLINHIEKIRVPVHITGAYQDEQTGPRGPAHLWERVLTPKRLVLSNGDHGTAGLYPNTDVSRDRIDFLNRYLHGIPFEDGLSHPKVDPSLPVRVYLEKTNVPNGIIDAASFPLPETVWRDWYFAPAGKLADEVPAEGSAQYVSGSVRNGWFRQLGRTFGTPYTSREAPDQLQFATTIIEDTIVAGPITASLDVSTTAADTELYVEVIDQAPDGTRAYLQRGLLRASHRAVMPSNSDCVDPAAQNARVSCNAPGAHLYRPYRPHAHADLLEPGARTDVLVEIWPLGHVFRAGHELRVLITTPPIFDNYYAYVPKRPAGLNTLHFGVDSKITLPVIPADAATFAAPLGPKKECRQQDSLRCLGRGQY